MKKTPFENSYVQKSSLEHVDYDFISTAFISNFNPLVVILDENLSHTDFTTGHKMWNICMPKIETELEFKEKEQLLVSLVNRLVDEHECDEHIYVLGSKSFAYEAMRLALLLGANAVYIEDRALKEQEKKHLLEMLQTQKSLPVAFVNCSDADKEGSELLWLCKKSNVKFKRVEQKGAKEVLDMLARMDSMLESKA